MAELQRCRAGSRWVTVAPRNVLQSWERWWRPAAQREASKIHFRLSLKNLQFMPLGEDEDGTHNARMTGTSSPENYKGQGGAAPAWVREPPENSE